MEHVIGWMTTKTGKRSEFLAFSQEFIEATRAEEGILFFELLPSQDHHDVVVAVEGYSSPETHKAHVDSAHFAKFWALFQTYVVEGKFENVVSASSRTDVVRSG